MRSDGGGSIFFFGAAPPLPPLPLPGGPAPGALFGVLAPLPPFALVAFGVVGLEAAAASSSFAGGDMVLEGSASTLATNPH